MNVYEALDKINEIVIDSELALSLAKDAGTLKD